jgi:hypothetical protein
MPSTGFFSVSFSFKNSVTLQEESKWDGLPVGISALTGKIENHQEYFPAPS